MAGTSGVRPLFRPRCGILALDRRTAGTWVSSPGCSVPPGLVSCTVRFGLRLELLYRTSNHQMAPFPVHIPSGLPFVGRPVSTRLLFCVSRPCPSASSSLYRAPQERGPRTGVKRNDETSGGRDVEADAHVGVDGGDGHGSGGKTSWAAMMGSH